MTPIQQLIRVSQRNTEIETGMWISQNIQNLVEREREYIHKIWKMSQEGIPFEECYHSITTEPYELNNG